MIRNLLYIYQQKKLLKSKQPNALKLFDKNKIIFFHIPKTGGVSICKSLFENLDFGHRDVKFYKSVFGTKKFNTYYKFCFVRNPYLRLYSAYSFLQKGGMNRIDKNFNEKYLIKYKTFEDFVKNGLLQKEIKNWIHFKPQHSFVTDKNNNLVVDFIGKLETIDKDFLSLKKILNKENCSLLHLNKTEKNPLVLNEEIKKIIVFHYKKDFELFYPELL